MNVLILLGICLGLLILTAASCLGVLVISEATKNMIDR